MLCFRCEYRAKFLENGYGPRAECKDAENSKIGCYMFRPCSPVVTEPFDTEDIRPRFGPSMISQREKAVRVLNSEEMQPTIVFKNGNQVALGWEKKNGN